MLKNRFFPRLSAHTRAVLQALFVTFLWSTSIILIKNGLQEEIPSLTFAGLRYTLAFLALLPFTLTRERVQSLHGLRRSDWFWLVILGLMYYTVTQGTQFVALDYLPAVTLSLILSFTAVAVVLLGIAFLAEWPLRYQWLWASACRVCHASA